MQKSLLLWLLLTFTPSCATTGNQCLNTPESAKVSPLALDTCEEALRADLTRQDVYTKYMTLLRSRERYEEVAVWSRRLLERDPSRSDALYNLAFALRKNGSCKEALKKYQSYAQLNPADPDPYYGIGLCYEDLGDREGALQAYSTYVQKEQRPSQREWSEKAKARIAMLGLPPNTAGVLSGHGATPSSPTSPGLAPSSVSPTSGALIPPGSGTTPSVKGSPSSAAVPIPPAPAPQPTRSVSQDCSTYEKAVKADPFATAMYDKYVECATAAGKQTDIVRLMRIALRDNPDYARGWLHLGQAYKITRDINQAKAAFSKACTLGVQEACGQ